MIAAMHMSSPRPTPVKANFENDFQSHLGQYRQRSRSCQHISPCALPGVGRAVTHALRQMLRGCFLLLRWSILVAHRANGSPNPVNEHNKMVTKSAFLSLSKSDRFKTFLTRFQSFNNVTRRFFAGEDLADAVEAIRVLNQKGISASFDHLGESITSEAATREEVNEPASARFNRGKQTR